MTQLRDLAKPFAARLVKQPPKGKFGTYVPHDVYEQKMIAVLGAPPQTELLRELLGEGGRIEGCVMRMTVDIDGRTVSVEEPGDCEQPGNWTTQGQRLKDASSDAYKRCCMRLGCGLHLWSGQDFFLYDVLEMQPDPQLPLDTLDPTRPFVEPIDTGLRATS